MKLQPWRNCYFNIDMVRNCSDCSLAVMPRGDETANMEDMFFGASSFAQVLCGTWITSIADKDGIFDGSFGYICSTTSDSKTSSMISLTRILTFPHQLKPSLVYFVVLCFWSIVS